MPPYRSTIPEKPSLDGLEAKWRTWWEAEGTYQFDRSRPRSEVFSIDTPPPTVSGQLHIGHVFSYTQTDLIARFQRMSGKEVFYPMGWDDNGLNVERRIQLMTGTIVDPTLPYDPTFAPPIPPDGSAPPPKRPVPVSRPNFIELCQRLVPVLEESYHELWSSVGLSIDWKHTYTTIGPRATELSQKAFLRLVHRGIAFRSEAPTLWDVDMRTSVAQAELEDREIPGAYHRIVFDGPNGKPLPVDTTRPELLPACVALVAHPDDERHQHLFGRRAVTPLFGVSVPIFAHELSDPAKGSGIAMVCTFGDTTDVVWWRELGLEVRATIQRDGRFRPVQWGDPGWESINPATAQSAYDQIAGQTVKEARARMVRLLTEAGALEGEPRSITHAVKFWSNGTRPLEIVTSHQWFIRYPERETLLKLGKELAWWPEFMRVRYENWVNGLFGDWNVSRQRFFGVPFPVWYPIDGDGRVDFLSPITASEDILPLDPTTVPAPGYDQSQRNQPSGFAADPDVMDTWATSSLSPFIVCGWEDDADLFERTFPMDMRPQSHDIIRTWLFSTVVRSYYELGVLPWSNAAISGFIVDPDRKKLSKSTQNTSEDPSSLMAQHGADAVRYWAAQGRPGMDLTFDEGQLKIGRRLATKLLNASRFALNLGSDAGGRPEAPLDLAVLAGLAGVVEEATSAFERFDYARAIERTEEYFWPFCDDYLELVKNRAYGSTGGEGQASAQATLAIALETFLKLFAPFLPYVTEEIWSWWRDSTIHRERWPDSGALRDAAGDGQPAVLSVAGDVLREIRKAKTQRQVSMRTEVARLAVNDTPHRLALLTLVESDIRNAAVSTNPIEMSEGEFAVAVSFS